MLIETSDAGTSWQTVGVGANIVEASWQALGDSLVYGLLRAGCGPSLSGASACRPARRVDGEGRLLLGTDALMQFCIRAAVMRNCNRDITELHPNDRDAELHQSNALREKVSLPADMPSSDARAGRVSPRGTGRRRGREGVPHAVGDLAGVEPHDPVPGSPLGDVRVRRRDRVQCPAADVRGEDHAARGRVLAARRRGTCRRRSAGAGTPGARAGARRPAPAAPGTRRSGRTRPPPRPRRYETGGTGDADDNEGGARRPGEGPPSGVRGRKRTRYRSTRPSSTSSNTDCWRTANWSTYDSRTSISDSEISCEATASRTARRRAPRNQLVVAAGRAPRPERSRRGGRRRRR